MPEAIGVISGAVYIFCITVFLPFAFYRMECERIVSYFGKRVRHPSLLAGEASSPPHHLLLWQASASSATLWKGCRVQPDPNQQGRAVTELELKLCKRPGEL